MATCFVFMQYCNEEKCLSLRLDQQGGIDAPLLLRSASEIKMLQESARTIVVLPTEISSLHEVELPWLGEQKARAALPYALEEQLAQNVTSLHFAFDRQHYHNGRYLVVVVDKARLRDTLAILQKLNLDFQSITLDWFALRANEACMVADGLLVHDAAFKGALDAGLSSIYLNTSPAARIFSFRTDKTALQDASFTLVDSPPYVWLAERLLQTNAINLCQGEFSIATHKKRGKYWYRICLALIGLWVSSLLVMKAINLHATTKKMVKIDQQIAIIYKKFFPQATQIISPRFRINQLLQSNLAGGSVLWVLLDKLALFFNAHQFTIEQFHFQNESLSVTLMSKDFSTLEELQLNLQKAGVKVVQSQAISHEQKVRATLELSL